MADDLLEHRILLPRSGVNQYPTPMDWSIEPNAPGRAPVYLVRMAFLRPLARVYHRTQDERYAQCFVRLVGSFLEAHPLTDADFNFADHRSPRRWGWMDLSAVRRAQALLYALSAFAPSPSCTDAFLRRLLAGLYDHAHLMADCPRPHLAHNMTMSEQDGLSQLAEALPCFADHRRWLELAAGRMGESLLAQTTADGVQTEWAPSYHQNVTNGALRVLGRAVDAGLPLPPQVRERALAMVEVVDASLAPSGETPDFGDSKRSTSDAAEAHRVAAQQRQMMQRAARLFDRPDLTQRWDDAGVVNHAVERASRGFPQGGLFILRGSDPDAGPYLALHNPPGPVNFHDEPDNGTFELHWRRHWPLSDPGFYTYGEDAALRAEHRRTCMHSTLTLDDQDSAVAGSTLLWRSTTGWDCVVLANQAYPQLLHRRSVWRLGDGAFVCCDEALGGAPGVRRVRFGFAPGAVTLHPTQRQAVTALGAGAEVGVSVLTPGELLLEAGWRAHEYQARMPRTLLCCPWQPGMDCQWSVVTCGPASVELVDSTTTAQERMELTVRIAGRTWRLGRDLHGAGDAWCTLA